MATQNDTPAVNPSEVLVYEARTLYQVPIDRVREDLDQPRKSFDALTDAADPSDYWKKMRKRDPDLGKALQGGGQFAPPCLGVRDGRRDAETPVLEHRGHLSLCGKTRKWL